MWRGLFENFRKMRYVSCDVAMACASMLPADPLQIGVEAGDIAPQDMFNPILYKACSNDSMSNLLNRIYAGAPSDDYSGWFAKNSVTSDNSPDFHFDDTKDIDQFAMYYGLLSDTSGWKKAMPQAGLQMSKLVPITWSLLATQGQPNVIGSLGDGSNNILYPTTGALDSRITNIPKALGRYMRGSSRSMPAFDTMVITSDGSSLNDVTDYTVSVDNSGANPTVGSRVDKLPASPASKSNNFIVPNLDAPDCFVAAIVLPPAKLNRLYYRLKVTWTIEFSGPRPLTDLTNWYGLANVGVMSYGSDYESQSALITKGKSSNKEGMVDTGDVDITKVMEGSK